jgi:hypothetical protein
MIAAFLKSFGTRISAITGMYPGQPQLLTKIEQAAVIPAVKVGWAIAKKPSSNGPVWGAAAGRSLNVTPMTTTRTPAITDTKPIVRGQVIFPQVLMHEKITVAIVPTKVNATEHAPWLERAFRAMLIARRLELLGH